MCVCMFSSNDVSPMFWKFGCWKNAWQLAFESLHICRVGSSFANAPYLFLFVHLRYLLYTITIFTYSYGHACTSFRKHLKFSKKKKTISTQKTNPLAVHVTAIINLNFVSLVKCLDAANLDRWDLEECKFVSIVGKKGKCVWIQFFF